MRNEKTFRMKPRVGERKEHRSTACDDEHKVEENLIALTKLRLTKVHVEKHIYMYVSVHSKTSIQMNTPNLAK